MIDMSYGQAYSWAVKQMEKAQILDAPVDAWLLLSFLTKFSRTDYYMHVHKPIDSLLAQRFQQLVDLRCRHIPLQHITNEQSFMGLSFFVNEHVLIPRQETELLALKAENDCKAKLQRQPTVNLRVLDLCCGSGCIILALKYRCPQVQAFAVDISREALAVAKENARRLNLDVTFQQSDLLETISEQKFDIIVSNPPYIETGQLETLAEEVKRHEPRLALDGGEDGLFFYDKIIRQSRSHLKEDGTLLFEIGFNQGEAVRGLMEQAGFKQVEIEQDMSGLDRIVSGGMRDV